MPSSEKNKALLLLHTGSPEAPERRAVAAYLQRFLLDPHILEMPAFVRTLLVRGIIVPLRAKRSTDKYKLIWTDEGSPLQVYTDAFARELEALLPDWIIETAGAYGTPDVTEGLRRLCEKGVNEIIVFPLFPHYADATRGSLNSMLDCALKKMKGPLPKIIRLPVFYARREYLDALAALCCPLLEKFQPDHVLFSYHGLPLKQAHRPPGDGGALNYEEQCEKSTDLLARVFSLCEGRWSLAYQSRFGRGWLEPSTRSVLQHLARSGAGRVALIAPSFVTDCLETLEELDMDLKEVFLQAGGEELLRIPSLNTHPAWVQAAADLVLSF